MISLCVVTRKRPQIFKRLTDSIFATVDNSADIEFVVYRDNDDTMPYEYPASTTEIVGERVLFANMWNECYKRINGDICMMLGDDFVFHTKGWDVAVNEAFQKYDDRIVFVWANDLVYQEKFGSAFFLHKNWINTVGYFAAPYFNSQYIDNWWNDVSKRIERQCYLPDIVIKHENVLKDRTHREYIHRSKAEGQRRFYYSNKMRALRRQDAKKLLRFIAKWNPDKQ